MIRHTSRAEMTEDQELTLNAWLVFHGINLAEAERLEVTGYGYMIIQYRDNPISQAVELQLEMPDL